MKGAESPWSDDGGVDLVVEAGVATLTLNRPPGNAWTPALGVELFEKIDGLASDTDVRALVLTGAGDDFCTGADGNALDNIASDGEFEISATRPKYWMAMSIGKPVVAAVNGACFGVGMQLALFCDVRFAGTGTKFSTAFVRRGLVPELGMAWLLPRLVGLGSATDLLLSGRLVRAAEAGELGLVNRVVDDDQLLDAAADYARQLAERCSPASMATVKWLLAQDQVSTLPEAVERADARMEAALVSDDFAEGVRSWQEKRAPAFSPLDPALAHFPLPGEEGGEDSPA
jgi:enoyl-CoA hydratase/carnithine racemase